MAQPLAASQGKVATASPASLEQIAAAARILPHPAPSEPAPASVASAPPPAAKPKETTLPQRPATRAETLVPATLMPPPASAAPRPQRERPGAGLHIGTLEVRVVAPAPQVAAAAALPAARQAGRAAAAPRGRIARGFGVFGLGQS